MADLPFAPVPPLNIRLGLGPTEWEACLDTWLTLCELTLKLPHSTFQKSVPKTTYLYPFLISAYHEISSANHEDVHFSTTKAISLKKSCFKLVARISTELDEWPGSLATLEFISNFCHAHIKSKNIERLLALLWTKHSSSLTPVLQRHKSSIIRELDAKNTPQALHSLAQLGPVIYVSADAGALFITGTDILDSMLGAYNATSDPLHHKAIVAVVSLGLISLLKVPQPNTSILSDDLYVLKDAADKGTASRSLLADLVTNTALLAKLRLSLSPKTPERVFKLLDQLETYRTPSIERRKRRVKSQRHKTISKKSQTAQTIHVHKMSLVTQVQDLFPDLGAGFVLKLLDHFNDNSEEVTAALLDDSLPPHLVSADRTEPAPIFDTTEQSAIDNLAPQSTPPLSPHAHTLPARHNVFDSEPDAITSAQLGTARLHIGKRDRHTTDPTDATPNKAAILSALAAFDSDDDERDDTYDATDVGGTIDRGTTVDEDPTASASTATSTAALDATLFAAYTAHPALFARSPDVRRSPARAALLRDTRLTHEAVEGWAALLARDPRRRARLEARARDDAGLQAGGQTGLPATAWRAPRGGLEDTDGENTAEETEGSGRETAGDGARGRGGAGRGRGRGRGRGGRGRGGGGGEGQGGGDPARMRRANEANKGSRANHNRRDARARKMARGGFAG